MGKTDLKKILSKELSDAVKSKSISDLKSVAQKIFDAGFELEEMKIDKVTMLDAMNNLAGSGWSPGYMNLDK